MSRHRVLMVPEWYPWADEPGEGPWARERALALSGLHDVAVVASRREATPGVRPWSIARADDGGVPTLWMRYGAGRGAKLGLAARAAGLLDAQRALAREGFAPDLIHASVYPAAAAVLPLARRLGVPLVVSEHYTGYARGLVRGRHLRLAKLVLERADVVCPDSRDLGRQIEALGIRPRRLVHVHNLVDTEEFARPAQPPARASEDVVAVCVAGLHPKKGHRFLLEAMRVLTGLPLRLEIAGDGPIRTELEQLAGELGVSDRVRFLGNLDKHQLAELLHRSDLFVLPSLFENSPHAIMEAMAAGLPVVATDVGGVADLVEPGTGLLVSAGDPAALAAAIERTCAGLPAWEPAPQAARAAERFGIAAGVARWTEIYDMTVAGHG